MQVDFPSKHSPTRSTPSSGYSLLQKLNATENAISGSSYNDLFNHNTHRIPIHRVSITSRNAPTKQTFTETRRETHRKVSSPITGIQSSYEFEHKRSNSPALSDIIEEDSFRRSITPTSSTDSDTSSSTSVFPRDFNSDVFYQSIFQPEIFTDDRNKKYIEMKLDIHDYNPDKIKVSINDNDLIVHVEHTNFYKQITLPSNVDFTSLALHYHHDKKLYITVKLLDEHSSLKYI
jgi:HSP20 family molecular chaperone IbpA